MNPSVLLLRNRRVIYVAMFFLLNLLLNSAIAGLAQSNEFHVGSDDVLKVSIQGRMDYRLSEDVTISPSGGIMLSIMKEPIIVDGLTIDEIDIKLTEFLGKHYLFDPQVHVEITKYLSKKILVIGEVKSPGEIALQKDTISLKELMIQTGGPIGDINKTLVILREETAGSLEPIVVNLDEILYDDIVRSDVCQR